ncbi:hypothetical protein Tco_0926987 [Tanacetum coccineum]|uniref:Uncharacterized protein n=1 Tax=Tanacetum coccineum TaxID=301880 RepID=A0ABQ5DE36_9ASTR
MVSSFNDEIDFRISFNNSDNEDYTVIFDKNSFSYKIISTNDLKTDSKNDNEKVNMPSLPPPELTVSCFDDLDFFNDFENEFPAIVYNDAQMSKSDLLTEPILSPQHIDEFDLNDETSLSKYDEEEQNILYFNDLFSFNIIHPNDLMTEKDNDDNEIDIIQSSGGRGIHRGDSARFLGSTQDYLWEAGGGRHLKRHAKGRKSGARLSGGHLIRRLAHHFDLRRTELVAAAAALGGAEVAPDVDEGAQAVSAPVHAPPHPHLVGGRNIP